MAQTSEEVLEAISSHVDDKVIRHSLQGFAEGKSCLTKLITYYDGKTTWMDEGKAGNIVYLNFIKAFNTHLSQYPDRQSQEVWIDWADSEVDWELAEQQTSEGHNQWHKD